MIVAFSTSSPVASVALINLDGSIVASSSEEAPMRASGACLSGLEQLLSEHSLTLADAEGFAADVGPGSFTGVRVGVTIAKALAWTHGKRAAGLPSFDLIDPTRAVAVPSKKGEWFLRLPGEVPVRTDRIPAVDAVGYGTGIAGPIYPSAARFADQIGGLIWMKPEELLPLYLIEPSISKPKVAYALEARDG